jgi:alkylhydroperoxidase family enzyme
MFKQFDETNAPDESKPYLANTKASFGMIPNLEKTMAAEPTLLSVYSFAWDKFDESPFSKIEQQVIYQTVNFENECNYCVPWHTVLSKNAKMPQDVIDALREGTQIANEKLEALSEFTRRLVHSRGKITQGQLDAFFQHGYEEKHALAVVLGIAIKTMSNFTNSIAETPLDKEVQAYEWRKPTRGI